MPTATLNLQGSIETVVRPAQTAIAFTDGIQQGSVMTLPYFRLISVGAAVLIIAATMPWDARAELSTACPTGSSVLNVAALFSMLPNQPTQESGPLLGAAINCVRQNPGRYTKITVDPGYYYFLQTEAIYGTHPAYVPIVDVDHVVFDFQGANLTFTQAYNVGLLISTWS